LKLTNSENKRKKRFLEHW